METCAVRKGGGWCRFIEREHATMPQEKYDVFWRPTTERGVLSLATYSVNDTSLDQSACESGSQLESVEAMLGHTDHCRTQNACIRVQACMRFNY